MNVRVGKNVRKSNDLKQENQHLEKVIYSDSGLPSEAIAEVKTRTGSSLVKEHEPSKTHQKNKFSRLWNKKTEFDYRISNNH